MQKYCVANRFLTGIPQIEVMPPHIFDSAFNAQLNTIVYNARLSDQKEISFRYFWNKTELFFSSGNILKRTREKPLGYAGDYYSIDLIYQQLVGNERNDFLWDCYAYRQSAPIAVRNRKQYFITLFDKLCEINGGGISVLDIASGTLP